MPSPSQTTGEHRHIRIWDLPIRLFHWLIVALFAVSWWTAENDQLDWHFRSGYAILALLLFRLFWGFAGGATARFASFIHGPGDVLRYARHLLDRPARPALGHNPMGGWSVAAILLLLSAQVGLGLFAIDVDGVEGGPFSYLVSFETARRVAWLHGLVFNVLLGLTGLHVVAIAFYLLYKRENLVAAMVTGYRRWSANGDPPAQPRFASLWRAFLGFAASIVLTLWIVGLI